MEQTQKHIYTFFLTHLHKFVYTQIQICVLFTQICRSVFWMGYFFACTQIEYTNYPWRQTNYLFPFFVFSSRSSDDSSPPDLIFSRSVMTLWKKYFYSKCTKKNQDHSSNRGIEKYFTRYWKDGFIGILIPWLLVWKRRRKHPWPGTILTCLAKTQVQITPSQT